MNRLRCRRRFAGSAATWVQDKRIARLLRHIKAEQVLEQINICKQALLRSQALGEPHFQIRQQAISWK